VASICPQGAELPASDEEPSVAPSEPVIPPSQAASPPEPAPPPEPPSAPSEPAIPPSQAAPPPVEPAIPPAEPTILHAEPIEPAYPSRRTLGRWILIAVAFYVVGWLLVSALPSLTPFIIGLVLAYVMLPLVNQLARKMPRWLAILTVYAGGIVLVVVLIAYIAPVVSDQIEQLANNFPALIDRLQVIGRDLLQQYQSSVPPSIRGPLEEGVRNGLRTLQSNISTYVQGIGAFLFAQILQIINTVTFLVGFLIIPVWLFYVLNDVGKGRAYVDRLLHARARPDFWNIWGIIDRVFSDYIRGQLLLGVAVGAMVGVFLVLLGLFDLGVGNYILLLAIIAGITELIPIIGPIIGAIPGVIIGFTVSPGTGLAVLLVYVAVQQLENNLLVPRIIGESVGIHPALLTVVLIAMGHVFGLLGVVLAAPLSAIARDLFIYVYRRLDGLAPAAARMAVDARSVN
jgi:predicted PurR-regulated permease PerM